MVGGGVAVLVIEVNVAVTGDTPPSGPSAGPATATPTGSTNDVIAPAVINASRRFWVSPIAASLQGEDAHA